MGNAQFELLFSMIFLSMRLFNNPLNFVLTRSGTGRVFILIGAQPPVSMFISTRLVRESSPSDTAKASSNSSRKISMSFDSCLLLVFGKSLCHSIVAYYLYFGWFVLLECPFFRSWTPSIHLDPTLGDLGHPSFPFIFSVPQCPTLSPFLSRRKCETLRARLWC